MLINIGINGFGRIGRIIFRKCFEHSDLQVVAVNDPAVDIDYICYLIKFDSTHGRFKNDLKFVENEITIDDTKINVFHEKLPSNIPWQTAGVQYVVEASGMFTNLEKASGHLASESVKRVIITAPSVDVPMMILGVNEDKISTEQKVISCASSTLYCLAPLIKVLDDNYGVAEGFITSIHAMTPSLKPLDGLCLRGKHWRDHRSIHQNIIPAATGACKALGKIIPQVKDKMTGLAFRVPIVNVSVLDVTIRLNKNTTLEDIIQRINNESQSAMNNIINVSSDEAVSSDFLGDIHSCILDENSSLQLTPNFFKLICWYENEYSYACRVVDTIMYSEKCFHLKLMSKIRNDIFMSNKLFQERNISLCDKMFVKPCFNINKNKEKELVTTYRGNYFEKFPDEQLRSKRSFIHSDLFKETRNNDIFEIWNDDIKVGIQTAKQNNNESVYLNCAGLTGRQKNESICKTEERVDEDKAQIIQMMHKTNNLLLKSNSNKCRDEHLEGRINKETMHDLKLNTSINISKNYPVSSESRSNLNVFQTNNLEKKDDKRSIIFNESTFQDINLKSKKENKSDRLCAEDKNVFSQILIPVTENNKQSAEILENASDIYQVFAGDFRTENTNSESVNMSIINSASSDIIPNLNDPKGLKNNENDQIDVITGNKSDHNLKYSIEIGIIQSFGPCKSNFDGANVKNNVPCDLENNTNAITDNGKGNCMENLQNKILEGIISTLSVGMALVETESHLRAVNTNTSISNGDRGTLSDIYDKLDSASGTDSENSFQMKERKSQVLNIADLTTSIENIARLDKICKIIEISDELSDKLFSVLDSNKEFKRKNWSLKDLCERLKLDEFCNNVFGQTKFCDF